MGRKFTHWRASSEVTPENYEELSEVIVGNRRFHAVGDLQYGDYGLEAALKAISEAISQKKKIALYADYDVDGTMSCVSWIWFLKAIGHENFVHHIPCRFTEGYGVNLAAIKKLINEDRAELIITMDTGITANEEAAYCASMGVEFICTDHHKIQPDRMPNCIILNPKLHPDEMYQELCGCGITFVLLRRLAEKFSVPNSLWTDLLALTGMATICDVVPLNGVNHRLAKLGVQALARSQRSVLQKLRKACSVLDGMDEKDVGFRLGPRINAVGRLDHADVIIRAFVDENPDELIPFMDKCNENRKAIQKRIVIEARTQAVEFVQLSHVGSLLDRAPILFLGGDWHQGVVGIAASKIAEEFWRPTWLFSRSGAVCKGSARSVPGFDVTEAMVAAAGLFTKFGGHRAAGGFAFSVENEGAIRERLINYASEKMLKNPAIWESQIRYDCDLEHNLVALPLVDQLDGLKPFGHGFEEPRFRVEADLLETRFLCDKQTGERRHTQILIDVGGRSQKIMFFHEVHDELEDATRASFVVSASKNHFRGETSLSLIGHDFAIH